MNKLSKPADKPAKAPAAMVGSPYAAVDRKYKAEDALRTLTRADEIRRDGSLMKDVQKLAKEQMGTLAKVAAPAKKR